MRTVNLPRPRLRALLAAILLCGLAPTAAMAVQLLTEPFTYPNGNLIPNGGWAAHHAGGSNPIQVSSGEVFLRQGLIGEDANRAFAPQPSTATTYACFKLRVPFATALTAADFFAHFKDLSSLTFRSRVFIVPIAGEGGYTVGISTAAATPTVVWPDPLVFGQSYRIVHSYEGATGNSQLWVDPVNPASPSITATSAFTGTAVSSYAWRQAGSAAAHDLPETVDNLSVGTSFDEACVRSDLGILNLCVTEPLKQCSGTVFTTQPWHTRFTVVNQGQKPVEDWSFDILIRNLGSGQIRIVKQQIAGPSLAPGQGISIIWPGPAFTSGDEGQWEVVARVQIEKPANPDRDPVDNQASASFVVEDKSLLSDIGVQGVCVTRDDSLKQCTNSLFTQQPWHVLFQVVNKGGKPIDNWSFDILLSSPTQPSIVLKQQATGPPLEVAETRSINWPSPYIFDPTQMGDWRVDVVVKVKDPTNPEPPDRQGNNQANATFRVRNKPAKACNDPTAVFAIPPGNYDLGRSSFSVTSADFNEDGIADLVNAGRGSTVSVRLGTGTDGTGDGRFGPPLDYTTGTDPWWVTSGDFNEDGITDLATANLSGSVSILLGQGTGGIGDGSFGGAVNYFAGQYPVNIVTFDANDDGILDLVVTDVGPNNSFWVLLGHGSGGTGDGTFAPALRYSAGVGSSDIGPSAIEVADFNEDGIEDLAIAADGTDSFSVFLGKGMDGIGNGEFESPVRYVVGRFPVQVAAADLNGDGITDLACAVVGIEGMVAILIGRGAGGVGNGSFDPPVTYPVPAGSVPRGIGVADFDNDYALDLVIADHGVSGISFLPGAGDGSFGLPTAIASVSNATEVWVGDFKEDGSPDVAVVGASFSPATSLGNGGLSIHLGQCGVPRFPPLITGFSPPAGRIGDAVTIQGLRLFGTTDVQFNGVSGVIESASSSTIVARVPPGAATGPITVTTPAGTGTSAMNFFVGGTPNITSALPASGKIGTPVAIAGNGFTRTSRVAFGPKSYASFQVVSDEQIIATVDRGAATGPISISTPAATGVSPFDFVLIPSDTTPVRSCDPDSHFKTIAVYPVGAPSDIATGDFNGDGVVDIAVMNSPGNTVTVLPGLNGDPLPGAFGPGAASGAISNAGFLAVGDFNGDQILDIVTTQSGLNDAAYWILFGRGSGGRGDGTFAPPVKTPLSYPYSPLEVLAQDLNADGILDLVFTNSINSSSPNLQDRQVLILRGNGAEGRGDGTFQRPAPIGSGGYTTGIASGDFNGDGITDLAACHQGSASVSTLLGIGFEGRPLGAFCSLSDITGIAALRAAAADFNGDQISDLAVLTPGGVTVFYGPCASSCSGVAFGSFQRYVVHQATDIAAGDFNHDGIPDLAVCSALGGTVTLLLNIPELNGTFSIGPSFATGWQPSRLIATDINRDDLIDLLITVRGTDYVAVLLGNCVVPNRPPDCSVAAVASPVIWPPNNRLLPVDILAVTDPDADPVTIAVIGITQDEPVGNSDDKVESESEVANEVTEPRVQTFSRPAGTTCPNGQIVDGRAYVRAERSARGNGRVYSISFTATDGRDGECTGTVNVCVPHDSGQACVDDGQLFNSLEACSPRGRGSVPIGTPRLVAPILAKGVTMLEYALVEHGVIELTVYDVAGRRVAIIEKGPRAAGDHTVSWDTTGIPNGVYFYRLRTGGRSITARFFRVR